ncbi:MAG: META domain-containing protein [Gemmatimonadales bacterium]
MSRRGTAVLGPVIVLLAAASASDVAAQSPAPLPPLPEVLVGTRWRLVEFRSSEDAIGTQRPSNPSLYTMSLEANGTVNLQLDCNLATGTWTATTAGSSFGFGPLRMTRTVCQQPSLDAQIARHTEYVSSFLVRDGLLYLNLTADGGTYVWEPLRE